MTTTEINELMENLDKCPVPTSMDDILIPSRILDEIEVGKVPNMGIVESLMSLEAHRIEHDI